MLVMKSVERIEWNRCHGTQRLADHWDEESSLFHLMCLTGRYHREMDSISPPRRKKYTDADRE